VEKEILPGRDTRTSSVTKGIAFGLRRNAESEAYSLKGNFDVSMLLLCSKVGEAFTEQ
jgi:hypothetical protein